MRRIPLLALGLAGALAAGADVLLLSPLKQGVAQSIPAREVWKVPLGTAIVEELQRLPGGRLYAALRRVGGTMPARECLVLDEATGQVLWRHLRTSVPGSWNLLHADGERLVFAVAGPGRTGLAVLDARSGAELWGLKPAPDLRFVPMVAEGLVVQVAPGKAGPTLTALRLGTGAVAWTRELDTPLVGPPVPVPEGLLVPSARTVCWRAVDGAVRWTAPVRLAPQAPRAVVDGEAVWLVGEGGRLVRLDAASGALQSDCALPPGLAVTNVYPLGPRLFLRGRGTGASPHVTLRLDPASGQVLWSHADGEPGISNLLEVEGRTLFATPSRVVAVDGTGKAVLDLVVARVGKGFPNLLRPLGEDGVLFVGEAILTALNPRTGQVLWRHGHDPLHQDAETDALARALVRAGEGVAFFGGGAPSQDFGPSLSERYQNEARSAFTEWRTERTRNPGRAEIAYQRGQIASGFSRAQAQVDFHFAMMALQSDLGRALNLRFHQEQLAYYTFLQRSILKGYRQAMDSEWVLRPTVRGDTAGFQAIRLPEGTATFLPVGVQQGVYGLWVLPAAERGLVFHEALRPSAAGEPDKKGYRPYENHLMATPLPGGLATGDARR